MRIVILGNQARALSNFWTVLIKHLISAGHEVICLVPEQKNMPTFERDKAAAITTSSEKSSAKTPIAHDQWELALTSLGAHIAHYRLDRKGMNLFRDMHTIKSLYSFFLTKKPDILFASTIKPVIYGAFASALAKYPEKKNRHMMITGLGYMFEGGSMVKRLFLHMARLLYRLAFSFSGTVYFQNNDDRMLFEKLSILPKSITVMQTKGTGVDLAHFPLMPMPLNKKLRFLLVGRLLEAKGIEEFCKAAAMVKPKYPETEFCLLGPEEKGAGAYPLSKVKEFEKSGYVNYLGETHDVRPYLNEASVVVLPSWREGVPCSLMEAMSSGRPVIAADAPGSRDVVVNNYNGMLIPVKDPKALANAIESLIVDPAKIESMAKNARAYMEEGFSAETVAETIMHSMGMNK